MGLFDFLKPKKSAVLSQEVLEYAQGIDWSTLLTAVYKEGSMNQMLQKLALRYRELGGNVEKDNLFNKLQSELNKLNQSIFEPVVDYKALFDKFLTK